MMDQDRYRETYAKYFMKAFEKVPLAAFSIEEMETLLLDPFPGYVISLREPVPHCKVWYEKIDAAEWNCKGMLKLYFEDAEEQHHPAQIIPELKDVKKILDWTKDIDLSKDRIAVHCTAGISRSSATAYIVACSKMPVEKALGVFDPMWHDPNWRIVGFGADILGSDVYNKAKEFYHNDQLRIQSLNQRNGG